MDILLQPKSVYPWYTENGISVRGYFQSKTVPEVILRDSTAVNYFSDVNSLEDLTARLEAIDGVFSVIIDHGTSIYAAVDRARSMPLYYAVNAAALSDDSKSLREYLHIGEEHTDPLRMAELLVAGVVSDRYTVYQEIRQLPMATVAEWRDGTLRTAVYYSHIAATVNYDRAEAKTALRRTAEHMMDHILKVVADRPIVLSLSGGYDSRFVACMLKERGAKNVYCYTYGDKSSFEVGQSKKVAEALGYQWKCVTYTDEDVAAQIDEAGQIYINTCYQHDFTTYLQNYIAVKRLHEENWFPANAVFLTGLCHDMPTGEYQMEEKDVHYPLSAEGVAQLVLDQRFIRYHLKQQARGAYLTDLQRQIKEIGKEICTFQDFVQVKDVLDTGFDHSRRFLPINHSHEFFGYEWLLPCWNQELLDFWYSLPYTLRVHQNLYEEWLMEDLCEKYGVGTKKAINQHTPYPLLNSMIRHAGGIVAWYCFHTHTMLRLHTDINGGALLRQKLYDRIQQKQAIKYSRASMLLLLTLYLMEQRYGTHFWKELRNILEK